MGKGSPPSGELKRVACIPAFCFSPFPLFPTHPGKSKGDPSQREYSYRGARSGVFFYCMPPLLFPPPYPLAPLFLQGGVISGGASLMGTPYFSKVGPRRGCLHKVKITTPLPLYFYPPTPYIIFLHPFPPYPLSPPFYRRGGFSFSFFIKKK